MTYILKNDQTAIKVQEARRKKYKDEAQNQMQKSLRDSFWHTRPIWKVV